MYSVNFTIIRARQSPPRYLPPEQEISVSPNLKWKYTFEVRIRTLSESYLEPKFFIWGTILQL